MAMTLNPYLAFDRQARAAMEHYQEVFGGQLQLLTFAEFGQTDPDVADLIMHSVLTTPDGFTLMAADQPGRASGGSISIIVGGDDEPALRRFWDGLSDSAQIAVPLGPQPWGDTFGMSTDSFGVTWQINIATA